MSIHQKFQNELGETVIPKDLIEPVADFSTEEEFEEEDFP